MTVRTPMTSLEDNDGNIQFRELTNNEMDNLLDFIAKLWGESPSVYLTANDTGNLLDVKTDTYYLAGNFTSETSDYASEEDTNDTVQSFLGNSKEYYYEEELGSGDTDPVPDTGNLRYPLYWDDSTLSFTSMSRTDFYDTFIFPAIQKITNSSVIYNGMFIVSTRSSLAGHTKMATDHLDYHYSDRYANVPGTWDASEISGGNADDYNQINYHVHSVNSYGSVSAIPTNAFQSHGDLLYNAALGGAEHGIRGYTKTSSASMFQDAMRWAACGLGPDPNYKISYRIIKDDNINLSSYNLKLGSMTDTYYPDQTFGRRYVGANDYRTQNWPSGTPVVDNWYLGIKKT